METTQPTSSTVPGLRDRPTADRPTSAPDTAPSTGHRTSLESDRGKTKIADSVVAKIAGLAAREIGGVYSMGRGMSRAFGALRARVGTSEAALATQGVSVEVGEREAAIDLDIVTWYGESIVGIAESVRRGIIQRVEGMTGLRVVEVNITVDDIYVEGDNDAGGDPKEARVQ